MQETGKAAGSQEIEPVEMSSLEDTKVAHPETTGIAQKTDAEIEIPNIEELVSRLTTVYNENRELKDKLLRSLAEIDNMQRRKERELIEARAYGAMRFARDMLEFSDNLHRALSNVPEHLSDTHWVNFVEGLSIMERNFSASLARHNIHKIDPLGHKFDPNQHEALFEIQTNESHPGTVVQVIEPGFSMGERILRPAKVAVAAIRQECFVAPEGSGE